MAKNNDEKLALLRASAAVALTITGHVAEDGSVTCPNCGRSRKGSNKVFEDGVFHCYPCGFRISNAIDYLAEKAELSFRDAVAALENPAHANIAASVAVTEKFVASPDPEVYSAVLQACCADAAVEFYGRWMIDADIVRESRAAVMDDPNRLKRALVPFGADRLIAAGVVTEEGRMLINRQYPVVEPHILPDGRVSALQFRASLETERKVAAHKDYRAAVAAAEAAGKVYVGDKVPHVAKFLSLRGASIAARCGFGLPRIAQLIERGETGGLVYVVEGFKDLLAARTMKLEAFGTAGAGLLPVAAVSKMLGHFDVRVALDGDKAGDDGSERVIAQLAKFRVRATRKRPPDGMDMTDMLVAAANSQQTR